MCVIGEVAFHVRDEKDDQGAVDGARFDAYLEYWETVTRPGDKRRDTPLAHPDSENNGCFVLQRYTVC